jgi:ABC-type transport system involved in multi-copper enzyme maturation permease subunit
MTQNIAVARRMIGAEFLKLRKKRGTLGWSLVLAAGSVIVLFVWRAAHLPSAGPPAGGIDGYTKALEAIGIFMGPLAAVLIGAQAGAGDHAAGVFRDLVATGRSRLALFGARVPGALALCSLVVLVAYATVLVGTFALAGNGPTPSASVLWQGLGWALLVDGVVCVVAVGLASLTLSRPATITTLIGFELVASPLLLQTSSFASLRPALLDASVLKLAPVLDPGAPAITESVTAALGVMAAWLVVALAVGAWRTARVDA